VLDFVRRIFDDDMMTESLKRQNIDIKKMPLGSLSRAQVSKGYEILCAIQENLQPAAAAEGPPPVEAAAAADEEEEEDSIAKERCVAAHPRGCTPPTMPAVLPPPHPPRYSNTSMVHVGGCLTSLRRCGTAAVGGCGGGGAGARPRSRR
jgi:hypothetical protein